MLRYNIFTLVSFVLNHKDIFMILLPLFYHINSIDFLHYYNINFIIELYYIFVFFSSF